MEKSKKDYFSNQGRGLHGLSSLSFERLIRLKEQDEPLEFNKTMQLLLPDLEGYIARRLSTAVKNGNLPSRKYKVEDFTNEIYLKAFRQIWKMKDGQELLSWLYEKADELLDDKRIDEEFNETFFDNIDKYAQKEWQQMQEDFSTDGDGDLMLLEEFDDPSYPTYEYQLEDVFVKESPENEWLEKLNFELSDSKIHGHIDVVLNQLPSHIRSIYDLAVHQRFKPYEISKIKRISVYQVEQYLSEAKEYLKVSFEKRFQIND